MRRLTVMRATWIGLLACALAGVLGLVLALGDGAALAGLLVTCFAVGLGCLLWVAGSAALGSARDD